MSTLLDKIKLPETLRDLSTKQLEQVAAEIRQELIKVAAQNGGHLASSLGAVELAVSLHAVFQSPQDKIIWDVGHQAYAHKILTGRLDRFSTLRQRGGLSGFPNAAESPHDPFTVGHASTSISQALGLVKARDLAGEKYSVIAVIGDGSVSGGLAFEGINNVNGLKSNMIVILNDNEMSISKNVGAISNYLTQVSTSGAYKDLRDRIEGVIKRIPKVGVPLFDAAKKLKDRTRHLVLSFKVDVIFEELGFKYFGPINGHNLPLIISTLHHAKEIEGPVLIHLLTKKGQGYPPAEADPTRFHGTGPFEVASGKPLNGSGKATFTSVFGETLLKAAVKDPKLVGITAAMLDGTGMELFAKKFPERFFDVGIAEEHAVTFAGALAKGGFRPIVAIYSTFLQRAYDQIIHDVALQNLPVIFAVDRAGIVGEDGATHNGIFDLAYLRTIPNLVIMAPKDGEELATMLELALQHNGPTAIRYPRASLLKPLGNEPLLPLELGRGEIVHRSRVHSPRSKQLLIAIGSMVGPALEAAKLLEEEAIAVTVINARFLKPLDQELLIKAAKTADGVTTVEEGISSGGFGSAVLELFNRPVLRLGLPDIFIEHGKREELLAAYGLSASGIAAAIRKNIGS